MWPRRGLKRGIEKGREGEEREREREHGEDEEAVDLLGGPDRPPRRQRAARLFPMMPMHSSICASVMVSGGAKRMMLP